MSPRELKRHHPLVNHVGIWFILALSPSRELTSPNYRCITADGLPGRNHAMNPAAGAGFQLRNLQARCFGMQLLHRSRHPAHHTRVGVIVLRSGSLYFLCILEYVWFSFGFAVVDGGRRGYCTLDHACHGPAFFHSPFYGAWTRRSGMHPVAVRSRSRTVLAEGLLSRLSHRIIKVDANGALFSLAVSMGSFWNEGFAAPAHHY